MCDECGCEDKLEKIEINKSITEVNDILANEISNNLKAYQSYLANMMVTDTEIVEIHEANLKTSQALYKSFTFLLFNFGLKNNGYDGK